MSYRNITLAAEAAALKVVNSEQADLMNIQTLAADLVAISEAIDVSDKASITLGIIHAKDNASASVVSGSVYTVEISLDATGNRSWFGVWSCTAGITVPTAMVTDGIEAIGQTVIECGNVIPAVGDIICFKNATIGNTEFREVVARVTAGGTESVTLKDALEFEQAQGTYYTQVEKWCPTIPLDGALRLRVKVDNNRGTTNRAIIFQVLQVTCDGIG